MNMKDAYSVERMADRMQIQDVMYRWCRAVDRLDFEGIRAVFHPDATDTHGPYDGGVEGLIDWIRERHLAIPFSMHAISNILIEFASADLALVETYVRTIQQYPPEAKAALAQLAGGREGAAGAGVDLFTGSRYADRFERRDGEWRIARRTLIHDWKQLVEVSPNAPKTLDHWVKGTRSRQDFVYRERAAMGIA
ncbi:MAG: nuclear transport factor 2 family protein [Burkholderiales bacterium]